MHRMLTNSGNIDMNRKPHAPGSPLSQARRAGRATVAKTNCMISDKIISTGFSGLRSGIWCYFRQCFKMHNSFISGSDREAFRICSVDKMCTVPTVESIRVMIKPFRPWCLTGTAVATPVQQSLVWLYGVLCCMKKHKRHLNFLSGNWC
jgi:hypothetical protein